jgi:outer membrane protein TolC
MKNKIQILILLLSFGCISAQQKIKLSLKEAIEIATTKSNNAILANTKVATSKLEVENIKNNMYPSVSISGQYLLLTNATVNSNLGNTNPDSNQSSEPIQVSSLLLGQANVAMPIFNGFKLKNSIAASKNLYESQVYNSAHTKERIALQVVELFAKLYQTEEMILVFNENIKRSKQRVFDFSAMVENGLLARNDLLKAQLQESNLAISLDNSIKNNNIINYKLATILQLPENSKIEIDIDAIKQEMAASTLLSSSGKRNDLEALTLQEQATKKNIAIAKSNYYPAINLIGGYIAFDLKNVFTVTNAMNVGVGVSYDLASIFKNPKQIKLAKSKSEEVTVAKAVLSDQIKEEIQEAKEEYDLSQKQNLVYKLANEQGQENYRIVKDKYDNSLSDTNDLLEADVQQVQSKINLALSEADIALKYYQLQFAQGNLLNAFNLSK